MITCFIYKNFDNSLFSLWFLSNNKNVDITFAFIKKNRIVKTMKTIIE